MNTRVGIAGVTYRLPSTVLQLDELHARGSLRSAPEMLAGFGFQQVHIADTESAVEMAMSAVDLLLGETGVDPEEIGAVLYAGALASSSSLPADPSLDGAALHLPEVMDLFKYPVSRIQAEFGLTRATAIGVNQQACASLFSAIRIGRDMLLAEPDIRAVLCVAADKFPAHAPREMIYNVISDAACAALLRKDRPHDRILACGHVTKGAFWDASEMENEIIAAYFPTARTVIHETLGRAGLALDDIAWIVPHNVSLRSWEILLGLLELPRERLFADNIARVGHTIASDSFLNLRDLLDSGRVRNGDRLLLFTFGYGLNWSCIVVEH
ncbi:MAG: 3-oxoacyl-ACP synthase III family protein [Gemmatimonadota bacterium]